MSGLTDTMKRAVFDSTEVKVGEMVLCEVTGVSQNTLFCNYIKPMSVQDYFNYIKVEQS
jgi:hypothetical protein